jgi:thiol-disulfide isomerase/thioredoxin
MSMKTGKEIILWAWALFMLVGPWGVTQAEASANEVMKIDPDGVEKLKEADNCPIIISIVTARCGACRRELPVYQEMYEQYKDQGLGINVVSIDFAYTAPMQRIVDQLNLTFPVYWGGEAVMHAYDISLVPYKFVVQNGHVVEEAIGGWSEEEIRQKIEGLMETCER